MYPRPLTPPKKRRRSRLKPFIASLMIVASTGTYAAVTITQPFALLEPTIPSAKLSVTTPSTKLPWPTYGQGAVGLGDGSVIATQGEQKQVPIASVSKVILALAVLEKYPLTAGQAGPTIVMTRDDIASYNRYIAMRGSVMGVYEGQKLSQRQMIQGIMLPSANNIADSLAIWAFGSITGYHTYANTYLKQKGFTQTKVGGDASGYSNESVSTAGELIKLGALAMQNAALAEIVGQKSATISGTGQITNYNNLLGISNITGIKTGNNDGNGGVFLGSSKVTINGRETTIISALSGAPNLSRVLRDSGVLLSSVPSNFVATTVVKKDAVVATYRQADNSLVQAVAAKDLVITTIGGATVEANIQVSNISYNDSVGKSVGKVSIPATSFTPAQSVAVVLKQTPTKPDIPYRLLHP